MKALKLKKNLNRKFNHYVGQQEIVNHQVGWIVMNKHYLRKKKENRKKKRNLCYDVITV